jgi:ribose-phosphate pyrophosphokinase
MELALIILAAGKGTRMESDLPKVLHPLGGKPLVAWVLESALALNPQRVVVVTGHKADEVEAAINKLFPKANIEFVRQKKMLGTGHAVQQAKPLLGNFKGNIAVMCGDVPLISQASLKKMVETRQQHQAGACLMVCDLPDGGGYGRVVCDKNGQVQRIVEAKDATPEELALHRVNAGTYCFDSARLWPRLDLLNANNKSGEFYLTDVIGLLNDTGEQIDSLTVDEREMAGINTKAQLLAMEQSLGVPMKKESPEAEAKSTKSRKSRAALDGPLPSEQLSSHLTRTYRADGRPLDATPEIKIFSGGANPSLSREIARLLKTPLGSMTVTRFADGETRCAINESIRGNDVFIIQPTCAPVNDTLMELLIMCDAFKRASARRIVPIMPYFGYARQDKKVRPREPITAKLVADLITLAGADRLFAIDLHAGQIQGFFDCPVDHLPAFPLIAEHLIQRGIFENNITVVSPDVGGVVRASIMAERIGAELAIVAKRRPEPGKVAVIEVIGKVENQTCIMIDDMVDSAGTLVAAADELAERGAKEIYACATHPVLSGDAVRRVQDSCIKELIVTDTIPIPPERMIPKITVLSAAQLCADAILRIHTDDSVSTMFGTWERLDV